MIANLAVLCFGLAGFVALALAMERHARLVLRRELAARARLVLRAAGALSLVLALAIGVGAWRYDVGLVAWLGWLAIAGLLLVFALPRFAERAERKTSAARARAATAPTPTPTPTSAARRPAAIGAVVLFAPAAVFAWQLASVPLQPLLREDALSGSVGPWSFVFAERDRKPPRIEALGTPIKEFVIRFCESCDAQIHMAYLKMREPRSLRASGSGFEGARWDRSVGIAIPPSAKVEDRLWLTVQGRQGEVHRIELDLERVSPALARFIRERT